MNRQVSQSQAILILALAMMNIFLGVNFIKSPTAITLLFGGVVTISMSVLFGIKYTDIQQDIVKTITSISVPILIVLSVGLLVGAWMVSGTIPLMIYYGMKVLTPETFLFMVCIICTLMSVMAGTSWGTISTVGVAFMGVAVGLNVSLPMTAGAIVSGAIFGDKLSPLSDSTVLSSACCEVNLVDTIKHSVKTTFPAFVISLVVYYFMGSRQGNAVIDGENYNLILNTLESQFVLSPVLIIPPILILALIIKKQPTLPVFMSGIICAVLLAVLIQGESINNISRVLYNGYKETTNVDIVDKMVMRGGLNSMLGTVALLVSAAVFGSPLRTSGVVDILLKGILSLAKTPKSMMTSVFFLHGLFFAITGSYYVTYSVLGPMIRDLFDKFSLNRVNLARIMLDTGTGFAPIVPWSVTGGFIINTLGVSDFIIYAPVTYLSIVFSLIYILTGFTILKSDDSQPTT